MPSPVISALRQLDFCLQDREALRELKGALDKIEKCCQAVENGINLADLLSDPKNQASLQTVFGKAQFALAVQLICKLGLESYTAQSFSLPAAIQGQKKLDFLYRSIGGWKQFDGLALIQTTKGASSTANLLNLSNRGHWQKIGEFPKNALITVYLRTVSGKRNHSQEAVAAERIRAVFDMVASRNDLGDEAQQAPKLDNGAAKKRSNGHNGHHPVRMAAPTRTIRSSFSSAGGEPSFSFQIVIHKMDTFVHAGNAQLIVSHLGGYQGQVKLSVLRAEKTAVQLDADSIWGAEIRNGETVVYDFYGPKPSDEFVKELAKKTNKYTQMDKLANE